jgi:hypothetical protein
MDINEKYFSNNTRGYKFLNRFYLKYRELFAKTAGSEFEDFRNRIFFNISGMKISEDLINQEGCVLGAIKIQCRTLLDKAIKSKPETRLHKRDQLIGEDGISISETSTDVIPQPHEIPEGEEVFNTINLYKLRLKKGERDFLNNIIDEKIKTEIGGTGSTSGNAGERFFNFLRENKLNYKMFTKFHKSE